MDHVEFTTKEMNNDEEDRRQWQLYAIGAAVSTLAVGYAVHQQRTKKLDYNIGSNYDDKTVIITGSNTGVGRYMQWL